MYIFDIWRIVWKLIELREKGGASLGCKVADVDVRSSGKRWRKVRVEPIVDFDNTTYEWYNLGRKCYGIEPSHLRRGNSLGIPFGKHISYPRWPSAFRKSRAKDMFSRLLCGPGWGAVESC